MNKILSCVLSLICTAVFLGPMTFPPAVQAQDSLSAVDGMRKKRYRYRKRRHRVQVAADFTPWSRILDDENMNFNVDLLYGYNTGWFEIGPNVKIVKRTESTRDIHWEGGIWMELNFIKNTRKQKVVPALGLKLNYFQPRDQKKNFLLSPSFALKYFPASRTGLVANVNWNITGTLRNLGQDINHGVNLSLAYVHYFHW